MAQHWLLLLAVLLPLAAAAEGGAADPLLTPSETAFVTEQAGPATAAAAQADLQVPEVSAAAEYAPADISAAQLSLAAAGLVNTAAQQCQPTSTYCGGRCVPTDKDRPACITSITVPGNTKAAGVALQGRKPGPPGMPPTGPSTLACDVGGVPGTAMKYSGTAFDPASFMMSCLGDAAYGCEHSSNTADKTNPALSCCSCLLYTKYCSTAKTAFATDKDLKPAGVYHVLVMPSTPCPGVERYDKKECQPGNTKPEGIWAFAQSLIDGAGLKDTTPWAMAINPVSRRGQHQMHVHVARVFDTMHTAIAYAHWNERLSSFQLDFGTIDSTIRLMNCKIKGPNPSKTLVEVVIKKVSSDVSEAAPFQTSYGKTLDKSNQNLLWASTLVLRVPFTDAYFAILTNPFGPAECFFNPYGDDQLAQGCS